MKTQLTKQMPPIEALRAWCHQLTAHVCKQRGFAEVLKAVRSEQEREEPYRLVIDAIAHLLRTCEAAGVSARAPTPAVFSYC